MIDLHTHLGGAVPAAVLWEILCDGGLQTNFKSFDQLQDFLTVSGGDITSLDDFLKLYFHATELIQSSPSAAMVAAYQAVAKAYRRAQISGMEVRYNPIKRLREGYHTIDSIILATIQGLQRASMHYQVRTGILFSLGKELKHAENWEIVQAALKFYTRGALHGAYGVIGIDMAGPESLGKDLDKEWLREVAKMVDQARKKGLGITWHVGETHCSGPEGMINILEIIQPDRIGHGIQIRKAQGPQLEKICALLRERNVCLELCPSVNVVTRSIGSYSEMAELIRLLDKKSIPYCINTDNPYIIHTNLQKEYDVMEKELGSSFCLRQKSAKVFEESTFMQIRR